MKLRVIAMLLAVPALIVGVLVSLPAEAATSHKTYLDTKTLSVTRQSETQSVVTVTLRCTSGSRCTGKLYFEGAGQPKRAYSVPGKSSRNYTVYLNRGTYPDPIAAGSTEHNDPGDINYYRSFSDVKLYNNEATPSNLKPYYYKVDMETRVTHGAINYKINGNENLPGLTLSVYRMLRGGNTDKLSSKAVSSGESGSLPVKLARNNQPSEPVALRLSAKVGDKTVSWWWRGSNNNATGGGRYAREATQMRATKDGFTANFYYGAISGSGADLGATVRALAPPASITSSSVIRRQFDVPSCANVFGEAKAGAGGTYKLQFLPRAQSADNRYMVSTKVDGADTWLGRNGTPGFGSCYALTNYGFDTASRSNLINFSGSYAVNIGTADKPAPATATVSAKASGFSPTRSDNNVRIREKVPDVAILDYPIVAEGFLDANGKFVTEVPLNGHYLVEVGRRTSCSDWYPSVYSNNNAYLKGEDRGAEAWKSFSTLGSLSASMQRVAIDHRASDAQKKKPKGKAGWMYRSYCKALGAGAYATMWATTSTPSETLTNYKGAIVQGRVTRTGGRTNKEMMVRLSNSAGTKVLRTDFTDSKGYFYVAGLADGSYSISVNSDSWRGIGRSFSGKHSITVKRGKVYNVGTLKFAG